MRRPIVLSLCDRTGVMVEPWLEAGYECWVVDTQHPAGQHRDWDRSGLVRVGCDVRTFTLAALRAAPSIVFAFPPCTHLSVSGARWFADKGLEALHDSLGLVIACKTIAEASGAPWMLGMRRPLSVAHQGETTRKCLLRVWRGVGDSMPEDHAAMTAVIRGAL